MPIINRIGGGAGGGSGAFAFILATHPAGASCTCTNTAGSKDISSTVKLFYVRAGTLPISCTATISDGTQTASKTVSIEFEGQSIAFSLSFFPEGYTRVEYIENTGSAYLLLPSFSFVNVEAYLDFKFSNVSANQWACYIWKGTDFTYGPLAVRSSNFQFRKNQANWVTITAADTARHNILFNEHGTNKVYWDGTELSATAGSTLDYTHDLPIFQGWDIGDGYLGAAKMKLYGAKFRHSGVLDYDLVPCYRNSDREAGLLNIANPDSPVFYMRATSATFVVGGEI